MSPTWKSAQPLAALLVLTLFAGCATSVNTPLARGLPPPPRSCAVVKLPDIPDKIIADSQTLTLLYDHRAGLATANRRIVAICHWYSSVRKDYTK